ncbi:hypothetical protein [Methanobrevibacter arboriphilus]|uniref:Uncharacterized protein n=1 Tax=Methanobrevibacter arboriphilus TaxID=39441 RepID=A0ACA8R2Q0_METAZ|nr:hypothetical protein [Methanobrevibacter arboriphilus]BBL61534.1 hypothetical protein MarbSA_05740 [Methanobrevibacter arboriphilus]
MTGNDKDFFKTFLLTLIAFIILISCLIYMGEVSAAEVEVYGYSTSVVSGWVIVNNTFINHCPLCLANNSLVVGLKRDDEITCSYCGADYSFDGYDKMYSPRARLIEKEEI